MAPVWEFPRLIRIRMCDGLATFPAKVVAASQLYGSAMFLAMAPAILQWIGCYIAMALASSTVLATVLR